MIYVEICVGSSCHLKGAPELVELLQQRIAQEHLEDDIILTGSFCTGKCNRVGVTVTVGDRVYTGVTREGFHEFWQDRILPALRQSQQESTGV